MMKYCLLTLLTAVCLLTMTSCAQKRPDGMPQLYPASVRIIQEGQPLADAIVSLQSTDEALKKWTPGGRTNASGIVELYTLNLKGAPEGSYKVTVTKIESDNVTTGAGPIAQTKVTSYNNVDLKFGDFEKTPLTIDISKKNAVKDFDVGKAIHEVFNPLMK